jgi:hypothetical protein
MCQNTPKKQVPFNTFRLKRLMKPKNSHITVHKIGKYHARYKDLSLRNNKNCKKLHSLIRRNKAAGQACFVERVCSRIMSFLSKLVFVTFDSSTSGSPNSFPQFLDLFVKPFLLRLFTLVAPAGMFIFNFFQVTPDQLCSLDNLCSAYSNIS